jgi:hypothetical protein
MYSKFNSILKINLDSSAPDQDFKNKSEKMLLYKKSFFSLNPFLNNINTPPCYATILWVV